LVQEGGLHSLHHKVEQAHDLLALNERVDANCGGGEQDKQFKQATHLREKVHLKHCCNVNPLFPIVLQRNEIALKSSTSCSKRGTERANIWGTVVEPLDETFNHLPILFMVIFKQLEVT